MYIYQNGKLYKQNGEVLVGVEIYPDKVIELKGTETVLDKRYETCTPYEVTCRFHVSYENPYIFPREAEVIENESIDVVKKPNRGRPRTK